jgi:hypothetical protein
LQESPLSQSHDPEQGPEVLLVLPPLPLVLPPLFRPPRPEPPLPLVEPPFEKPPFPDEIPAVPAPPDAVPPELVPPVPALSNGGRSA